MNVDFGDTLRIYLHRLRYQVFDAMERPFFIRLFAVVRIAVAPVLLFTFFIIVVRCDKASTSELKGSPNPMSAKNESERTQLSADVRQLKKDVERGIEKLRLHYTRIDKSDQGQWQYADRKLKSNRSKADRVLHDLHYSTDQTWESVKASTLKIIGDIKSSNNTVAYQFQELVVGK